MNVQDIGMKGRKAIRAMEGEMMDNFEVYGVQVHELTAAERGAFAEKARGMHKNFAAGIDGGPEILEQING